MTTRPGCIQVHLTLLLPTIKIVRISIRMKLSQNETSLYNPDFQYQNKMPSAKPSARGYLKRLELHKIIELQGSPILLQTTEQIYNSSFKNKAVKS